jgi:hypothetical protein
MNKELILNLVDEICDTNSTDCRSLNKIDIAKQLLNIANIPSNAIINEIPLDWNRQVVILFTLENDSNYYSLFSGIGNDGNFYFELTIDGIVNDGDITFKDEPLLLSIDYFVNNLTNSKLIEVCKAWDNETKGNMMESIKNDIESKEMTLKESLEILVNEHFPIWIEESEKDDKQFYIDFQNKFKEVLKEMK